MLRRNVIYVRCLNCSYNNVAEGIRLLDKKAIFVIQEKFHASMSFLKIYPLKYYPLCSLSYFCKKFQQTFRYIYFTIIIFIIIIIIIVIIIIIIILHERMIVYHIFVSNW